MEGDCGTCTVVIGKPDNQGGVAFKAVNACVQFLPTLDGHALFTVENLRQPDGTLHPVQQALVDCHDSQYGFCTPGFAMSMFALYEKHGHATTGCAGACEKTWPTREEISNALTGNLCRCTGYQPIIDATEQMFDHAPLAPLNLPAPARTLDGIQRKDTFHYEANGR